MIFFDHIPPTENQQAAVSASEVHYNAIGTLDHLNYSLEDVPYNPAQRMTTRSLVHAMPGYTAALLVSL